MDSIFRDKIINLFSELDVECGHFEFVREDSETLEFTFFDKKHVALNSVCVNVFNCSLTLENFVPTSSLSCFNLCSYAETLCFGLKYIAGFSVEKIFVSTLCNFSDKTSS